MALKDTFLSRRLTGASVFLLLNQLKTGVHIKGRPRMEARYTSGDCSDRPYVALGDSIVGTDAQTRTRCDGDSEKAAAECDGSPISVADGSQFNCHAHII